MKWVTGARSEIEAAVARAEKVGLKDEAETGRKKLAALNMGMARCKKRYHRQLYIGWELPAITNNVHVLFQCLYAEMASLRKQKRLGQIEDHEASGERNNAAAAQQLPSRSQSRSIWGRLIDLRVRTRSSTMLQTAAALAVHDQVKAVVCVISKGCFLKPD